MFQFMSNELFFLIKNNIHLRIVYIIHPKIDDRFALLKSLLRIVHLFYFIFEK